MINWNKIPKEGYILAYSYNKMLFDRYYVSGNKVVLCKDNTEFSDGDFIEIHFFDENSEYRLYRSKNEEYEQIVCADKEVEDEDSYVFTETQYLDDKYCPKPGAKLVVKNYFKFNQDDCLYLDNYRLAGIIDD